MEKKSNFREFARYTILNVMGMVGLSCYILADTYFVSKGIGVDGLAALNLAIPAFSFANGCGLMLGIGGATKYSVFRGVGDEESANRIFSNTMYLAVFFSVLFMLIGLFCSQSLATFLGACPGTEIYSMTNIYLKVILLFSPAFIINEIINNFVRNDGNPGLAMLAMLSGCLFNIVFDYIFIFPLNLGILGAVLATGAAPLIGMCILSGHWITKKSNFRIRRIKFSPSLGLKAMSLGIPSLVSEVSSGVVIIVFNFIFLRLQGDVGVAAYGVIANLSLVVIAVFSGMANGMQPLISRSYGQNDRESIKRFFGYAVRTVFIFAVGIYLVLFFLAGSVASVFNSEGNMQMQEIAEQGLRLYFIGVPFVGFNLVFSTYFTSTEKALPAQIISLLRGLVLIILFALLLSYLFQVTGVWLAFPAAEGITTVVGILFYRKLKMK